MPAATFRRRLWLAPVAVVVAIVVASQVTGYAFLDSGRVRGGSRNRDTDVLLFETGGPGLDTGGAPTSASPAAQADDRAVWRHVQPQHGDAGEMEAQRGPVPAHGGGETNAALLLSPSSGLEPTSSTASSTPRVEPSSTPTPRVEPSSTPTPRVEPSSTPTPRVEPLPSLTASPTPGSVSASPTAAPSAFIPLPRGSDCPEDQTVCVPATLVGPKLLATSLCRVDDVSALPMIQPTLSANGAITLPRHALTPSMTAVADGAVVVLWHDVDREAVSSPVPVPTPSDDDGTIGVGRRRRRLFTAAAVSSLPFLQQPHAAAVVYVPQGRVFANGAVASHHHVFASNRTHAASQLQLPDLHAAVPVQVTRVARAVAVGTPHAPLPHTTATVLAHLDAVLPLLVTDPQLHIVTPAGAVATVAQWVATVADRAASGVPPRSLDLSSRVVALRALTHVVVATEYILLPKWHVAAPHHAYHLVPPLASLQRFTGMLRRCPLFDTTSRLMAWPGASPPCTAPHVQATEVSLRHVGMHGAFWGPVLQPAPGVPLARRLSSDGTEWAQPGAPRVVWVSRPPRSPRSIGNEPQAIAAVQACLPPTVALSVLHDHDSAPASGGDAYAWRLQSALRHATVVISPPSPALAGLVFAHTPPAVVLLQSVPGRKAPPLTAGSWVGDADPGVGAVAAATAVGAAVWYVTPAAYTSTRVAMPVDTDALLSVLQGLGVCA